ncbi:GspE/PulE family protein [uncultured Anaerotruncus sp.]|uniref:GspE/PulE family protein n=1 Tax=uncultured Anaerotruncus sp. TaxID=905011 RepID=UPI00280C2508|nr:GspE/PulE family protein [uncultured Anaerotruncus sp.]
MKNLPLGQVLVEAGFLTPEKLDEALALQKEKGGRLGDLLVENGYVTEHNLMLALQQRLEVPFVDLEEERIDRAAVQLVPRELAQKYSLIPLRVQGGELTVATNNPLDFYAFGELGLVTGMQIVPVLATKRDLNDAIHRCYAQQGAESALEEFNREYEDVADPIRGEDYSDMLERVEGAPVVRLLNSIVAQAYHMRASDIHVEPGKQNVSVRFRVDGELIEAMLLNSSVHVSLITRLKILSGIDIGERRVPQDGRFSADVDGKAVNLRVSTLPTVYGEKAVLRIMGDNTLDIVDVRDTGISAENYARLEELMRSPNGIILVTGPTGSGKSTTIYAVLHQLSTPNVNVVTIEDPVEKLVDGISQVQINPKAGLTFASGLRSILRQDPDIIMIGEIRDVETARIAARAAITGHRVLTTIHTNDAASTFMRLVDMGVEPYIVASAVVGVVSQRLVRLVCPHCKREYEPDEKELSLWEWPRPKTFYRGSGCAHCNFTGYLGRTAIHEVVPMRHELSQLVVQRASVQEFRDSIRALGGRFLKDNLADLVREGKTTLAEYLRVTYNIE